MARFVESLERRSLLSTNLLTNGSFETPQIGSGSSGEDFTDYSAGQIVGAGWQVTANSVDIFSNKSPFTYTPAAGNQFLDLNGGAPGTISQTVTTKPRQRYTLRFAFTATPFVFNGSPVRTANVNFNGTTIATLSKDVTEETPSKPGWIYKTFTLMATSTSSTIAFVSTSAGFQGIALDDISFTAIPAGTASVSGEVFADGNGDGKKGIDAIGLSGWTVWIDLNGNGTLDSADVKVTTDHFGNFTIGQLAAGTYKLHIVQQTGWKLTTPAILTITLTNGQASTTSLFGEQPI